MTHPSPFTASRSSWLLWAAPVAVAALLGSGACSDGGTTSSGPSTTSTTGDAGGGGTGGSGGGETTTTPESAREFFEQLVLPGLTAECGACHDLGGPADRPFIGEPDPYVSITSWPGFVVKDPAKSPLVVHPAEASHGPGKTPLSAGLQAKTLEWLAMEAANLPEKEGGLVQSVDPFKPILGGALNTIYLDVIDPSLQYASISFNAKELDGSLLQLKNIEVHPVEGQAIHIIHPLFTVYPAKAEPDPDPIDSFSGVDQTFKLEDPDLVLGTGELILTNWQKDSYIGIAFEMIENEGGGGAATGCNDVLTFQNTVVPQMKYCADTCHGGANPIANATMDLSKLADDPPEAACAQVRARILPGDPANSQILIVTDPTQQVVHMYKFMGNKTKYAAFKDAVSPWINSEAQ